MNQKMAGSTPSITLFTPKITNIGLNIGNGYMIKAPCLNLVIASHPFRSQSRCKGNCAMACPPSATTPSFTTSYIASENSNINDSSSSNLMEHGLSNRSTAWLMLGSRLDEGTGNKLDYFYCPADGQMRRLNRKSILQVPETALCFGSTLGGWLGFVSEDGSVHLSNSFDKDIIELPSLESLPSIVGVTRSPNGSILKFMVTRKGYVGLSWFDRAEVTLSSLALSHNNPRDPSCVAMVVEGDPKCFTHYFPIGEKLVQEEQHYDDNLGWIELKENVKSNMINGIYQVVFSSKAGLFYTLFSKCGIQALDVHSNTKRLKRVYQFPWLSVMKEQSRIIDRAKYAESDLSYYLVSQGGSVLLIVRYYGDDGKVKKTLHFDVFKVLHPPNLKKMKVKPPGFGRLERTRVADNCAVFVGDNQSFCLKADGVSGLRPNCIYFCNENDHSSPEDTWFPDVGIFSWEDDSITPLQLPNDQLIGLTPSTFWVTPPDGALRY